MKTLLKTLFVFVFIAFAHVTYASDVFAVASGGLSSGTCSTLETACTLTRASSFCAGNHVYLQGGTYTTGLRCVGNGTGDADSQRSIFEGLTDRNGSNPVIIDGLEPTLTVSSTVRFTHNYGSVRNMILVVPEVPGTTSGYGVYGENVIGSEVSNVEIYYPKNRAPLATNQQQWGIQMKGTSGKITDNYIHDVNTGINVNTDTATANALVFRNTISNLLPGDAEDSDCINLGVTNRDMTGTRVASNTCSGYRDDGIDLFGASNAIAEDNTIGDPLDSTQTTNSCIKAGNSGSTGNIIRRNNCIHLLPHRGITQYGIVVNGMSTGTINSNVIKVNYAGIENAQYLSNGGGANLIANNTLIGGAYGLILGANTPTTTVYNNYLQGTTSDLYVISTSKATGGYNFLANQNATILNTYAGPDIYYGTANFRGGTSPTTVKGFKLNPASSLLGKGIRIGNYTDALGRPFDYKPSVGALEYGSRDFANYMQF